MHSCPLNMLNGKLFSHMFLCMQQICFFAVIDIGLIQRVYKIKSHIMLLSQFLWQFRIFHMCIRKHIKITYHWCLVLAIRTFRKTHIKFKYMFHLSRIPILFKRAMFTYWWNSCIHTALHTKNKIKIFKHNVLVLYINLKNKYGRHFLLREKFGMRWCGIKHFSYSNKKKCYILFYAFFFFA